MVVQEKMLWNPSSSSYISPALLCSNNKFLSLIKTHYHIQPGELMVIHQCGSMNNQIWQFSETILSALREVSPLDQNVPES